MKPIVGSQYKSIKFGMMISVLILGIVFPISLLFPETFPDFITENVSNRFLNKSWELRGIWLALVAGCSGMLVHLWKRNKSQEEASLGYSMSPFNLLIIAFLVMPIAIYSFLVGEIPAIFLHVLLIVVLLLLCIHSKHILLSETLAKKIVLLFIVTYYFGLALAAVINTFYALRGVTTQTIEGIALLLSCSCLYKAYRKQSSITIDRAIAFFQIFIPLNLCIFLIDRYMYEKSIVVIPWDKSYIFFYLILMLTLMFLALKRYINIRKSNEVEDKVSRLITLSMAITIFVIHSYISPAYGYLDDFWHPGDSMLAWQQGMKYGLSFYQEYSPNSGLFGLLSSFLQYSFLPPGIINSDASMSLEYTIFAIVITILLGVHFDKAVVLLISILFVMPVYSRILMILPVLLILMLPWLLRRQLYWICCWILLGILSFFFYPLNGVATVAGTFPLCLYQLYALIKKREEKNFEFKYNPVISTIICIATIVVVIFSVPLLYRVLLYVASMSGQTIWADGITVFPHEIAQNFFPWVGRGKLVIWLYDIFEFCIPICTVMLPLWYIACKIKETTFKESLCDKSTFLFLAVIISSIVNYQFAFIRMDAGFFLARANHFLYLMFILILPWAIFLSDKTKRFNIHLIHIGVLIGLSIVLITPKFGNEIRVMPSFYSIPEGFIYTEGIPGVEIGRGFIKKVQYQAIIQAKEDTDKLLKADEPLLEMAFRQMFYFVLDKKAAVPNAGTYIVASLDAQKANIAAMNRSAPKLVMYDVDYGYRGLRNYYMTSWLLSHHYIFYQNNNMSYFVHPERYETIFGNGEEAFQGMKNLPAKYFVPPMQSTPASWGNSLHSLQKRLQQISAYSAEDLNIVVGGKGLSIGESGYLVHEGEGYLDINLREGINGEEADFLYLDIEPILQYDKVSKKTYWKEKLYEALGGINQYSGDVKVYWKTEWQNFSEEQMITCKYVNGKLLIPANLVPSWRFANITGLRISLVGIPKDTVLRVNKVAFYKVTQKE